MNTSSGQIGSHYLVDVIERVAEERGWSMREVARRSGLPYATVQKIANRNTTATIPKKETLEALAYGLSVPVATLMDAVARDSGFSRQTASQDDSVEIVIAAMEELPNDRKEEIAALAMAMLASHRARGNPH